MFSWIQSLLDIIRQMCSLNWVKSVLDIIRQMCSEFAGHHPANVFLGECVFLRLEVCWTSSGKCGRWVQTLLDIVRRMSSLYWVKSVLDIIRQMCSEFAGHHPANVFLRLGVCRTSSGKCVPWIRSLLDIIRQMCS